MDLCMDLCIDLDMDVCIDLGMDVCIDPCMDICMEHHDGITSGYMALPTPSSSPHSAVTTVSFARSSFGAHFALNLLLPYMFEV